MSNILFSRLVHPQFSFLFSNYNPAMAKTTMKAQLKLRNLQLHPNNISFFLSAFGPFQLLNGSVSSLSIKKAIILSDTTPIQVVCGDVTLNLKLLTDKEAEMEYKLDEIPSLGFPAESIQSELDVSTFKIKRLKINLNINGIYTLAIAIKDFVLYATNENFLIDISIALRQEIAQKGFLYEELRFMIEKICIIEHKPNFDQLLGQIFESYDVMGRMVTKKRTNQNFNQSEVDIFMDNDLTFFVEPDLLKALVYIRKVYNGSTKTWDTPQKLLKVCDHIGLMLNFPSRLSLHLRKPILLHSKINDIPFSFLTSKNEITFTFLGFYDCISISKNFITVPEIQVFVGGELLISTENVHTMFKIPSKDPVSRGYLNIREINTFIEGYKNTKESLNCSLIDMSGSITIDTTITHYFNFKDCIKEVIKEILITNHYEVAINNFNFIFNSNGKKLKLIMNHVEFKEFNNGKNNVDLHLKAGKVSLKDEEENEYNVNEIKISGAIPFTIDL